ncbi:hypothetical protein JOC94_004650, partial [Bacillus thermophilus]
KIKNSYKVGGESNSWVKRSFDPSNSANAESLFFTEEVCPVMLLYVFELNLNGQKPYKIEKWANTFTINDL